MPLSGKYLNFISVKLPLFSLAITSHEGKGPAVLRWLRHLFMHSGPLLMPVGQGHKLLEAGKWFKLIFSRLAKPFNLVLWDTTRTCSSKKSEAAEAGQRSSGLFNKIVLRRVLLAWIYKLNVREKKLWFIYTQAPFLCPSNGSSPLPMVPHHHHPTSSLWAGNQLFPESFFPGISVQSTHSITLLQT